MPLTVGTAGHVDHGKTTLVRALTGKDTDRLPEERARGISIDLGYAPLELPSGRTLSLVDVPGHERFVRTMVAGATGIDLFLLVVDAAEGARPQTHEHLAILRLLGVEHGVVAVTKADAVDVETLELAVEEVRELVPEAEVVAVSGVTGAGLDELPEIISLSKIDLIPDEEAERLVSEWRERHASDAVGLLGISAATAAGLDGLVRAIFTALPDQAAPARRGDFEAEHRVYRPGEGEGFDVLCLSGRGDKDLAEYTRRIQGEEISEVDEAPR